MGCIQGRKQHGVGEGGRGEKGSHWLARALIHSSACTTRLERTMTMPTKAALTICWTSELSVVERRTKLLRVVVVVEVAT